MWPKISCRRIRRLWILVANELHWWSSFEITLLTPPVVILLSTANNNYIWFLALVLSVHSYVQLTTLYSESERLHSSGSGTTSRFYCPIDGDGMDNEMR